MFFFDLAYEWDSDNFSNRRGRANDHCTTVRGTPPYDGTANRLHLFHDARGVNQDFPTDVGDHHPPAMTLEQISAQLLFQQPDLSAQCRLRDM
ncbi:hypothetical protein D3C87_1873090 [compost metagenome]